MSELRVGSTSTLSGINSYRYVDTLYFTSSGTFVKADYPWLRAIRVKVQGGGGGSGGLPNTASGQIAVSGGGGGGAYAEAFITDIAGLSASETVTVAAGGVGGVAGGGNGTNAGASSLAGVSAAGGGGSGWAVGVPPLGALAADRSSSTIGADFAVPGGGGGSGLGFSLGSNGVFGGHGGSSFLSNGTDDRRYTESASNGNNYGGGAAGRAIQASSTGPAGSSGANGIVIVELFA